VPALHLETMTTNTPVIVLIPHHQLVEDLSLDSTVKSVMTPLVILTHVKMEHLAKTVDLDLLLNAHVLMDGSDPFAQFLLLINAKQNNVEDLEFVSPMFPNPLVSLDVSVLMDTLDLSVMSNLLFVPKNVKTMESVFTILFSLMVILKTLLVSVLHHSLDNTVNGTRLNGTRLHQPLSDSFLLSLLPSLLFSFNSNKVI
jgi:hypothetical protein